MFSCICMLKSKHLFVCFEIRKKQVSEQSCSSVRAFLSILAHLAHLAHLACFFLILKQINKCYDLSMQIQESMSVSIAGCLVE